MIHAADVREWRNRDVVDAESRRIGVLEAVYVDTTTDEPAMATVRTGLPTRHRLLFVPIENAIVGPDYLRVGYVRTLVKRALRSEPTTYCLPSRRKRSSTTTDWPTSPVRPENGNWRVADHLWTGYPLCEVRTMRQMTPPGVEHRLSRTAPSAGHVALLAEVVELRARNQQLGQAMESREVIDQARGMLMALAPCSSERAWDLLVGVSQHSNTKLRDVAAALVATTRDRTLPEPIQRELRRALRRLHEADRR